MGRTSEKLSDVVDKTIKYGGGGRDIAAPLVSVSEAIKFIENSEKTLQELTSRYALARSKLSPKEADEQDRKIEEASKLVNSGKQEVIDTLKVTMTKVGKTKT